MFVFEARYREKDMLVLFLGQYQTSRRTYLSSQIQSAFRDNMAPDCVVLLFPSYLCSVIEDLYSDKGFLTDITRFSRSSVLSISFDACGALKTEKEILGSFSYDHIELRKVIVRDGITSMVTGREEDVVVSSPPGTVFVKPSGKNLEEFIYASQLARNNFQHQFLAMSLLQYRPDFISDIYIDTSSISAVAEAVVYYLKQFDEHECKAVAYKTFSSYGGLDANTPGDPNGVWVIISASATTSMGQKLIKDWGLANDQVITILSFKNEGHGDICGDGVVYCVQKFSKGKMKAPSPVKVQVQGENFSVEVSAPDELALTIYHEPKYLRDNVYSYHRNHIFHLNRDGKRVYVDFFKFSEKCLGENAEERKNFESWLDRIAKWKIPAGLKFLCFDKSIDANSKLKDLFVQSLDRSGFNVANLQVVDSSDHKKLSSVGDSPIVIFSSAISSGRFFNDVNRELRLAGHTGMRIFLAGFATPDCQSSHSHFVRSLSRGVTGFDYSVHIYKTIFVGHVEYSPWKTERKYLSDLCQHYSDKGEEEGMDFWNSRVEILEQEGEGLSGLIGIHSTDHLGKLGFTNDFVFWPKDYVAKEVQLESVYVSIAAVLQFARENKVQNKQLGSNIYHHTVLAPLNFVRFNDPILQSALWRCASPREIDYRRSEVITDEFVRLLIRMFDSFESERGESSLDLLIAVAIGWIKLTPDGLQKLKLNLLDNSTLNRFPHVAKLLEFMNWSHH